VLRDRLMYLWRQARPALAAGVAILLVALVTRHFAGGMTAVLLVASMGAAATLLFCLPDSPLSRPWAFVGGHLVSVLAGITSSQLVQDVAIASALAVGGAILLMRLLNCLHPPGGAAALSCVVGGPDVIASGYHFLIAPVGVNVLLMFTLAQLYRAAVSRGGSGTRKG